MVLDKTEAVEMQETAERAIWNLTEIVEITKAGAVDHTDRVFGHVGESHDACLRLFLWAARLTGRADPASEFSNLLKTGI